jgi:hypothetical protein
LRLCRRLEGRFPLRCGGAGNVESHSNVAQRGLEPILRKAGIVVIEDGLDDDGKPVCTENLIHVDEATESPKLVE